MKNKGTKNLSGGPAMHVMNETNTALASVMSAEQAHDAALAAKKEKKKPVALGYRIFSALLLVLAVGGLFLGLLCHFVPALQAFSAYRALFGESAVDATLLGLFLEVFQNFELYTATVGGKLTLAVLFFFAICLLVCVACSLAAFISGKNAKICTYINVTSLFLGYATLFCFQFAQINAIHSSPELGFAKQMFDLPTGMIAAIALVAFVALLFLDRRAGSATVGLKCFNLLQFAFMLCLLFLFFYPGTATAGYMALISAGLFTANGTLCGVSVLLVAVLFAFNYFASALRPYFKKGFAFDTVRYGLQLCAIVFFFVMARDRAIFAQQTAVVVCMVIFAFLLFALPFLATVLAGLRKKEIKDERFADEAKELALEETQPQTEETKIIPLPASQEEAFADETVLDPIENKADFGTDESEPNEKYIDQFVAETIQTEKEETIMLEPTEEFDGTLNEDWEDETLDEAQETQAPQEPEAPLPAPEVTYVTEEHEEDKSDNEEIIVFTADNFDPNNPMLFATTGEPSGVIGAGPSFVAGMPPVRERIVEKIVEVEKKKPKVELTEFERQMAEMAKDPTPVAETAFETLPYADGGVRNQPVIQQTFITNPAPAPAPVASAPAPAPAPTVPAPDFERLERERRERERERYDSQYAYDPFISTLTPEERNEFGDVFISYRHGVQNYLPAYVIGGDNRKFFRLLFAQLGRYREFISQELMDKMYAYVSSNKK